MNRYFLYGAVKVGMQANELQMEVKGYKIIYNLDNGYSSYYFNGLGRVAEAYTSFSRDGKLFHSCEYSTHEFKEENISELSDGFGKGIKVTITSRGINKPDIHQNFYLYEERNYFLVQTELDSDEIISTNYIAPIVSDNVKEKGAVTVGAEEDLRFLSVPFDNDKWVRFESNDFLNIRESYEVGCIFDNDSRHGMVFGSINHDTWKTAVNGVGEDRKTLKSFKVYAGASSELTRDTLPHGIVSGKTVASPKIFMGFFSDYREGLEEYSRANTLEVPPLAWKEGVLFGWNSWAALADKLNYDIFIKTSDFFKENLQENGFESDNTVYINYDSFWSNLTEEQLLDSVRHVHENGQKVGIYWSPFACWTKNYDALVEGTEGSLCYKHILLRDKEGNPLPDLDGAVPIDPTHPGNLKRTDWQIQRFIDWGFDFVKLDFMAHGAIEGVHYNENITTGIQAYNFGMKYIIDKLNPEKIGRPFFISLSIAPVFPYEYGHSRRISCDAFGKIDQSEYLLNSITYGWWMNDTIYKYNDPDHTVLYKSFNSEASNELEAETRMNASVIGGTVLLNSDDLNHEEAAVRLKRYLTDSEINSLARSGISFKPVEGNTGSGACDIFTLAQGSSIYLAVFNFEKDWSVNKKIKVSRLGLSNNMEYKLYDLWSKETVKIFAEEELDIYLEPCQSKILRID